jgi:hypothetical protein
VKPAIISHVSRWYVLLISTFVNVRAFKLIDIYLWPFITKTSHAHHQSEFEKRTKASKEANNNLKSVTIIEQ